MSDSIGAPTSLAVFATPLIDGAARCDFGSNCRLALTGYAVHAEPDRPRGRIRAAPRLAHRVESRT
jgi:hypothetical protein